MMPTTSAGIHIDPPLRNLTGYLNEIGVCAAAAPAFNFHSRQDYRLIAVVSWRNRRVYVKALLSHREYERNTWHKWAF